MKGHATGWKAPQQGYKQIWQCLKERVGNEAVRVARLEREQADQRNHNRRRSRRKKTNNDQITGLLQGTSARGYVSWRNGDPCRICWPVPPDKGKTPLSRR